MGYSNSLQLIDNKSIIYAVDNVVIIQNIDLVSEKKKQ
jgi:hypothetical protein